MKNVLHIGNYLIKQPTLFYHSRITPEQIAQLFNKTNASFAYILQEEKKINVWRIWYNKMVNWLDQIIHHNKS